MVHKGLSHAGLLEESHDGGALPYPLQGGMFVICAKTEGVVRKKKAHHETHGVPLYVFKRVLLEGVGDGAADVEDSAVGYEAD